MKSSASLSDYERWCCLWAQRGWRGEFLRKDVVSLNFGCLENHLSWLKKESAKARDSAPFTVCIRLCGSPFSDHWWKSVYTLHHLSGTSCCWQEKKNTTCVIMTGGVTARSDLLPAGIQSGRRVSVENTRFQAVTFPFLLTKRSNAKQEEAVMKLCLVKEFFSAYECHTYHTWSSLWWRFFEWLMVKWLNSASHGCWDLLWRTQTIRFH